MPAVTDRAEIRSILETDRPWAAYALGDIAPGLFEDCQWYRPAGGEEAIALIWRAPPIPVLHFVGEALHLSPILDEVGREPSLEFHLRPEALPFLAERFRVERSVRMCRMVLEPSCCRPRPSDTVTELSPADFGALKLLYDDQAPGDGTPPYFTLPMLKRGIYYGISEGGDLVAAAGTHLVTPGEGVAALGNIYTRRDRRGEGLGSLVTGAVVGRLLEMELATVVLNVGEGNRPARRLYEGLGFRLHCSYLEGIARRCGDDAPGATTGGRGEPVSRGRRGRRRDDPPGDPSSGSRGGGRPSRPR